MKLNQIGLLDGMKRLGYTFIGVKGGRIIFTAREWRLAFKRWLDVRGYLAMMVECGDRCGKEALI